MSEGNRAGVLYPALATELLAFLGESVCVYDRQGGLTARLGPPGGILGHGDDLGSSLFGHLHPDDLPRAMHLSETMAASEHGWHGSTQVRLQHRDDGYQLYEIRLFNRFDDPQLDGMVVSIRELAGTGPDDPEVPGPGDLMTSMADALPTAFLVIGQLGRIRYSSPTALELLDTTHDHLYGTLLVDVVKERDRPGLQAAVADVTSRVGERTSVATTKKRYGRRTLEIGLHSRGTDDLVALVAVVLVDRSAEPELLRRAMHDPLTDLPNRTKVMDTVTGLLLEVGSDLSVIYIDLDRFKAFNDAHGHATGDRLLLQVAADLSARIRPTDLVGRMSGDEFVVVCPRVGKEDLDVLVDRLRRPVLLDGRPDRCITLSVGAATATPGDRAADLLDRSDQAMYIAKRANR